MCFRYFNHVLQSECCDNYICMLCIVDLTSQEFKTKRKIVCLFGCQTNNGANADANTDSANASAGD